MTQSTAEIRHVVARTGFANPLTLAVLVEDIDYLKVYADELELQIGVDYTVLGIGDANGVSIEIIGAEDVNEYVGYESFTALYDPVLQQGADLSLGGNFGRAFEAALDIQNRQIQAVDDRATRALKMPVDVDGDIVLPPPVDQWGLIWDADTEAFVWAIVNDAGALAATLPGGGSNGQLLAKASGNDFDTEWIDGSFIAAAIGFSPTGGLAATDVQAALAELDSEKLTSNPANARDTLDTAPYVATRTALKALDTTKDTVAILTEAGRQGTFVWMAGNYSTQIAADTQEGIYVKANAIASSAGAWMRVYAAGVNPVWFGADPTGTNDSAAALNSALAVSSFIAFPAGKFKFNSLITYNFSASPSALTITGAGAENTILYWPSTAGMLVNYTTNSQEIHFADLSFTTGTTNAGAALKLTSVVGAAYVKAQNDITRCTFRGDDFSTSTQYWTYGVFVGGGVSNVVVVSSTFMGNVPSTYHGTGLHLEATSAAIPGFLYIVDNCLFDNLNIGIDYNVNTQGVEISNSNFSGNYGIIVNGNPALPPTQMGLFNSQFNSAISCVSATSASVFYQYDIVGNIFYIPALNNGVYIDIDGGGTIVGNQFSAQPGQGTSGNIGLNLNSTIAGDPPTTVTGNTFIALSTGIAIGAAARNTVISGNAYQGNTLNVNCLSTTSIRVLDDPKGMTAAASVGASPATITAGPRPETHYVRQSATNTATVTKGGQQIHTLAGASTYYQIELGPNEAYVVTWTTTQPTYTKDVR